MPVAVEVTKLVRYVGQIRLQIPTRRPPQKHVGAIIADAILQVGHRWKTHVGPRVQRLRNNYPGAETISGLSHVLDTRGARELLDWNGKDEQERLRRTVDFFQHERIQTFDDLRKWLESDINRDRLLTKCPRDDKAGIPRIGNATADYYRVLAAMPDAVKVDSLVKEFLVDAGIDVRKYKYNELRTIVQLAAARLGTRPLDLDGAIWDCQERVRSSIKPSKKPRREVEMAYGYWNAKQACKFSKDHGFKDEVAIIEEMEDPAAWKQAHDDGVAGSKDWFKQAKNGANIVLWGNKRVPGYPKGRIGGPGWIETRKSRLQEYMKTEEGKHWLATHRPSWLQPGAATPDHQLPIAPSPGQRSQPRTETKRATIYLDPELHKALKLKAVETSRSVSELVNDAIREALAEDAEDLEAFAERAGEPLISYDEMVKRLKRDGRI